MRVFIIEDEDAAARRLQKLIMECDPAAEIAGRADGIETAVAWLESQPRPDLIFMDIHLSDGSAFEIFNRFEVQSPVIFSTAYDQYAIQAFKYNTVDYLLKPVKAEELMPALAKYRRAAAAALPDYRLLAELLPHQDKAARRFLIRTGHTMKVIDAADAAYFYSQNKITYLVAHTGKRYPVDYPLDRLEHILDARQFFRINRQIILSVASIKEMHAYSKSRVKIELAPPCGLEAIVSTEKSPLFKRWLTGVEEEE